MLNRICCLALYLLISLILRGNATAQISAYRFSTLDIENGLSNNSISSILQDSQGYLWFGSYYGLNRYNGNEVFTYYNDPGSKASITDNFVTALLEDAEGSIWVGTKYGLNRFEKDTEEFTSFLLDSTRTGTLTNNQIGSLFLDELNRVWIGTMGGGLHLYHPENGQFESFFQDEETYSHINHISAMQKGQGNTIWLGTYGDGLASFDLSSFKMDLFPFENMQVNAIVDDGENTIWIASNNMGLYTFDKTSGQYTKFDLENIDDDQATIIMSLTLSPDGSILASIDGGGVLVIDHKNKTLQHDAPLAKAFAALDSKAVYTVYSDSNGLYWIGTIGKGIRLLNMELNRFSCYTHEPYNPNSLSENAVIALLEDRRHRIWVGTDGGGLNRFDPATGLFKRYNSSVLKSQVVKRLLEDREGHIWMGTYGGGLAHFNPETERFTTYNPILSQDNRQLYVSVWSLAQQYDHQLWVGTLGNGLFSFNTQTHQFSSLSELYPELSTVMNDYILSLHVDSKQNLWIGTSNGIYLWYSNSRNYKRWLFDHVNNSGVGKNAILSITESHDGKIWVGSNGGGIIIINPDDESIVELSKKDGLVQQQVYDIKQDQNRSIWIATLGGISKYEIETGRFQNYDSRDGLMGSAFYTFLNTSSNQVYVGGVKGLNIFHANIIKINNYVPKVLITELLINNVPVRVGDPDSPLSRNIADTKELVLNHKQTNFGLEFIAINYFSEKNAYSYMLENSSKDWSESSGSHVVNYNNLKPGNYVFRVRAANNDGIWSTSETVLRIKVLAPWWKTWYAFTAYFLILAVVIYAYIRYSILWFDLRRKLEFEVIEKQKISELNQMRLQFFTNISHEFRTPLTLISGPLNALKKQLTLQSEEADLFAIIQKNTDRMLRLINQVMDFRKIETGAMELNPGPGDILQAIHESAHSFAYLANEKQMHFHIHTGMDPLIIQFDADVIEKVIYNLLSNAFKYGKPNGTVELSVLQSDCSARLQRKCLIIKVSDDGPGIPCDNPEEVFEQYKQFNTASNQSQPGTGIGLPLSRSLIQLHGGTLTVESERNIGTTFTATIPVIPAEDRLMRPEASVPMDMKRPDDHTKERPPLPAKSSKALYSLLVVDDNKEVAHYLNQLLGHRFRISKAGNGKEAFDLMMRRAFDLVITDVMMPVMDGVQLCKAIKTELQTSHIPVIMLSARSSVDDLIEGINTGADVYVPKPFNPDLLEAYIDNLLQSRQRLKEIFTGLSTITPSEITAGSVDEIFIGKALDIVKANMKDENFGVMELGQELNMSRSNLHRKLKAVTDKSTTDFIRTIRLKEAAAKLLSTDLQIAEIAYQVGFNSSSYFIKSFKREFSMSPGQYKQLQQKWN